VQPRQRVDRSVGAVRSRKGIVDVNVSEFGKSAREIGRVRFFLFVEAKVFERACAYRLCHPNVVPMETAEPSD